MLRTRVTLTIGMVLAIAGLTLVAVALPWLAANLSVGAHVYDPTGPLYKQISWARLGAVAGAVALLVGAGFVIFGLIARRRTS